MTTRGDRKSFRNEDLVLEVTPNIDPSVWDESKGINTPRHQIELIKERLELPALRPDR